MQATQQKTTTNEEPRPAHEEDVAVDRKDTDGEKMMEKVRNEKLHKPAAPLDKERS